MKIRAHDQAKATTPDQKRPQLSLNLFQAESPDEGYRAKAVVAAGQATAQELAVRSIVII